MASGAVIDPLEPNAAGAPGNTGVIIPTVLQMAADIMSYFTSMTCLYNRYWYAEQDRITLPIAMFHVTGITETWQNETSKKRVIIYEPPNGQPEDKELSDPLRAGVMQVFMDNVVTQPKSYQIEAVVPFQPIGKYINEGIGTALAVLDGILELFSTDLAGEVIGVIQSMFALTRAAVGAIEPLAEIAGKLADPGGVETINKNSLEAMAESGKVLTMKMWTGYHYKYALITGMTISKQPTETNVFRATIQLQEMPILTMTTPKAKKTGSVVRELAGIAGKITQASLGLQSVIVQPLIQSLGVVEASGQTGDLTGKVLGAVGL